MTTTGVNFLILAVVAYGLPLLGQLREERVHERLDAARRLGQLPVSVAVLGPVKASLQVVVIVLNGSSSEPGVSVNALSPHHALAEPTFAQFAQRLSENKLVVAKGHLVEAPRAVTLDSLSAIDYTVRVSGNTLTQYTIWRVRFVYVVAVKAPTKLWRALAPRLDAVAQSFRLTP